MFEFEMSLGIKFFFDKKIEDYFICGSVVVVHFVHPYNIEKNILKILFHTKKYDWQSSLSIYNKWYIYAICEKNIDTNDRIV